MACCLSVCCSGSAGKSAGRRGSRLGDLAIPAQVTRGPRPRPARRNRRGQLRRTDPPHASGGGERRVRCGTPARHRRRWRQAAVGGMDTSERAVQPILSRVPRVFSMLRYTAGLGPRCNHLKEADDGQIRTKVFSTCSAPPVLSMSLEVGILERLVETVETLGPRCDHDDQNGRCCCSSFQQWY